MEKENLEIIYKKVDELIPSEYNPKSCSPKEEAGIEASIKRFGFVDPLIINEHPDRFNIIVGGHQRVRIAKKLGYDTVPCVVVNLPIDKEKELNIRLSKNTASIDNAILAVHFSKELLEDVGFKSTELSSFMSDFEKQFNSVTNADCVYPLVPKFSEKHDALIIVSHNSTDTAFLETVLGIQKSQSYKNSRTGKAMVIDVEHFRQKLEER